jgi:hypothetical protein
VINPIAASVSWSFTLAIAFAPAVAASESDGAYPARGTPAQAVHHRVRKKRAWSGLRRPPQKHENLPAISRDPNNCVKTMCTCLRGGGC